MFSSLLDCLIDLLLARLIRYPIWLDCLFDFSFARLIGYSVWLTLMLEWLGDLSISTVDGIN